MLNDGARAPQQESKAPQVEPPPSPRSLFFAVFPSIMLPMFLAVVDQTIVATALPSIAASLGDVERISWIVIAYLIAGTVAAPVYGYYGDLYGRRKMMFVALTVFIAASCLCAAAQSMLALVLARVAQGLGGGGLMTLSQALIGETVPPRERARYQGYLAGVVVCSSTFGPVAGGLLTQAFGWRSVFFVNVPLGLIAIVLAPAPAVEEGHRRATAIRRDRARAVRLLRGSAAHRVGAPAGLRPQCDCRFGDRRGGRNRARCCSWSGMKAARPIRCFPSAC